MYVAMITLNVHTKCRYKHLFYACVLVNLILVLKCIHLILNLVLINVIKFYLVK